MNNVIKKSNSCTHIKNVLYNVLFWFFKICWIQILIVNYNNVKYKNESVWKGL